MAVVVSLLSKIIMSMTRGSLLLAVRILAHLQDYYVLTKPEVNLLILITTSAGFYLVFPGPHALGRAGKYADRHTAGRERHGNPLPRE